MNRRNFIKSLGLSSALMLAPFSVSAGPSAKPRLVRRHRFHMGTTIELILAKDDYRHETVVRFFDALSDIDHLLSVHRSASELSRVNGNPGQWHEVSPHFGKVATTARRLGEMTDGAFDVTILPLMRHWGFYVEDQPRRTFRHILERVDFRQLQVNGQKARIAESGYGADFGGIAKGYGVDQAVWSLRTHRVNSGLITAGGDIFALGRPAPDRLWRIGIRSPYRPDALCAMVELEDEAVATAGGYENYRISQGRRIAHILNPRLGVSSDHMLSATIIAPDTMTADALATATYVMGIRNAQRLLDDIPNVEGIWIDRRGRLSCTPGIRNRIELPSR